jgi:hypothetical protein
MLAVMIDAGGLTVTLVGATALEVLRLLVMG